MKEKIDYPVCPWTKYFESDVGKICDPTKCDYDNNTHSCCEDYKILIMHERFDRIIQICKEGLGKISTERKEIRKSNYHGFTQKIKRSNTLNIRTDYYLSIWGRLIEELKEKGD